MIGVIFLPAIILGMDTDVTWSERILLASIREGLLLLKRGYAKRKCALSVSSL